MENNFDLIVIGGGPGGYVGAIRASQLGMKVACVEKRGSLGGTCLNVGCIPSKALLESSEKYDQALNGMAVHGVKIDKVTLDLNAMMARKDDVILSLSKGVEGLFKKNNITYIKGVGKIEAAGKVSVSNDDGVMDLTCKNILIATGSESMSLPGVVIDEKNIVSSTGALSLKTVPKKMIVIGGGYIGLEMGSVWMRLGADVTIVEYLDKIVPMMDQEIARNLQKTLQRQGMNFVLGRKVLSSVNDKNIITLELENVADKSREKLEADVVLVSIGRKPHTENLGLENLGIKLDDRSRIEVDACYQTSVKNIYAIGDVIAGPMLAHKAEEEAVAAVEMMMGQKPHVNYNTIPSVIYTWPEVASVGKSEEELKSSGVDYKAGKFPFMANSRARASGDTEGMVKILACSKSDKILGVHIMGPHAGTMIGECVLAMEYYASSEDIARTCHAHPTLSEAIKEAALAVLSRTIHM